MEKKNKTPSEQKKSLKRWKRTCFAGEFVSAATPFFVIGIVNFDKYFIQYDGTKMSISFFLAMSLMGFVVWAITKKKLNNSFVLFLVGWLVCAFIFTMLGEMITDLATIMWFGAIGIAGALGLQKEEEVLQAKIDKISAAQEQADKEQLVEDVKQEKAEKTIKIKIKK